MKNWKIPAIILPLLVLGGYFALASISGGTLFIGEYAYDISGSIQNILAVSWLAIMLATAIWLLLVLPWKRMKPNNYGLIRI